LETLSIEPMPRVAPRAIRVEAPAYLAIEKDPKQTDSLDLPMRLVSEFSPST
jgi:hypothetical protein